MRDSCWPFLLSIVLLPVMAVASFGADVSDKLNVIVILMDDLGWKDLGCTGSTFYETPNIDRLAARGVMFTRSYAAAPICSPTRASVLTGLYPARIGLTLPSGHDPVELLEARVQKRAYTKDEAKQAEEKPVRGGPDRQQAIQVASATRLSTKYPSIAKVFKANGYRTAHFGKWHLGPEPYSALDHGFDVDVPHGNTPGPPRPGHFGPWPDWANENGPEAKGRQVDDCLAEHAIAFIRENKDRPFFVNFWPFGVHIPFQADPELVKRFEAKADPGAGQRNPLYAAMIKHTDDAIGRVWGAVEEAGLADKTVVVFLSDNGGVTAGGGKPPGPKDNRITDNAPLRGEKGDVYEGGVRVPGFIVAPGVGMPGSKSDLTFTSLDVLPTIADICGLKDLPPVDGRSLAPAVAGKPMADRPFFMHYPHYGNWNNGGHPAVTMVADGWKLIRFFFDGPEQAHRYEFYHLDVDPGESTDLSRQEPVRVTDMDRQIDAFLRETGAVLPQRNPDLHDTRPSESRGGTVPAARMKQPLPELPAVLRPIQPSPRSHHGEKGAELLMKNGLLGIRLNSKTPLTPEQWEAVASLQPRAFHFNDAALRDEDMDRLIALDPMEISLRIVPLTGAGAAKLGQMPHLRLLETHHMHEPTPEAKEALAHHPSLETFRTAGDFCIDALRAPKLKSVELAERAVTIASVEQLAAHSRIEKLSLFAHNILAVDGDMLTSVAKIKTLKTLRLSFVTLAFEGELARLLDLPQLAKLHLAMADVSEGDLQRLQAAMPQVKVSFSPMPPEYRKTRDELIDKVRKTAAALPAKPADR
ncbi:MAG: sulfatase [Planctomycetota bacterium]